MTVRPRTMAGVMELLPRDQVAFQGMLDTIRRVFERFGFLPIETPVMEPVEVLLTKSGGDTEKQVYFAQSTGSRAEGKEAELALRFDLTVPLARYVAQHENDLSFPFRRFQIQRVYRGERAQRGRYREFYQCDIDVIARDELSLQFDAEMPVVVGAVFEELGLEYTVRMNHRKLLAGYLRSLGIEDEGQRARVLREVDKLDKVGAEVVAKNLRSESVGLEDAAADGVMTLLEVKGDVEEVLAALGMLGGDDPWYQQGLTELREVSSMMVELGLPTRRFCIQPSICRGLDYYTGMVYETFLDDHPEIGSVCSGGRYDDLASHYTRSHLPGVGLSIGATRLFYQLHQLGLMEARTSVEVLVTQLDEGLAAQSRGLAAELRNAGIATELYHQTAKLNKQMKYANRNQIPCVVIMGQDEAAAGEVTLKDMDTGEQQRLPRAELVARMQARQG